MRARNIPYDLPQDHVITTRRFITTGPGDRLQTVLSIATGVYRVYLETHYCKLDYDVYYYHIMMRLFIGRT